MKKFYFAIACAALTGIASSAQQLPNVGFEGEWVTCYPWNTVCDTLSFKNAAATTGADVFGLQPKGWVISNVDGVVSELDGGGYGALGATEVGDTIAGYESATAVRLFNSANPFMPTQIVPGYLTLGTSWATNTFNFATFSPENKDGGTFGGAEMTARPDAITMMYKWVPVAEGNKATVLVYSWKGSWKQDSVPGNNSMSSAVVTTSMIDRDRNILGMPTAQGGTVTHSDDAELIAKSLDYISTSATDWTAYTLPIDYVSEAKPEKVNVVIASNDYFDAVNIPLGDTLIVDNVKFVYYSQLKSLSVDGVAVEGFSPDTYEYTLSTAMPADASAVVAEANGKDATVNVQLNASVNEAVITVANVGEDLDGKSEHIYTIHFAAAEEAPKTEYAGQITIFMFGSDITGGGQAATIEIYHNPGDPFCKFVLPNFSLDLGAGEPSQLGDIVVDSVAVTTDAAGTSTYTGHVDNFSLMEGQIIADIDLNGTITADGQAAMDINVGWHFNGEIMPIEVHFTGTRTGAIIIEANDNDAPAEYFDLRGVRVSGDNLPAGVYVRRQGNVVTKILVK